MENQHLTYFKIENFKRFDSFEMSNLGQFNLIVGDNNVGKTSVLEALCFDTNLPELADNYLTVNSLRENISEIDSAKKFEILNQRNEWLGLFRRSDRPMVVNLKKTFFSTKKSEDKNTDSIKIEDGFKLYYKSTKQLTEEERQVALDYFRVRPKAWLILYSLADEIHFQVLPAYFEEYYTYENSTRKHISFIASNQTYDQYMVKYFYDFFNSDKDSRKVLLEAVKYFVPNVEEVRVHKINDNIEFLGVILSNENGIYPISRYGEATIKYIQLIIDIVIAKGRHLMIDEIGSGIHFTRLKDYWRTIIQLCAKYDVQLFATTHSLECQQAFIEALEDPNMQHYQKDARNISLIENKQGEVKAVTYDFEQFEYALTIGFNTRGGAR